MMLFVFVFGAALVAAQSPPQTDTAGDVDAKAWNSNCPRVFFSGVEKPKALRRSFSAARSADLIFHVLFESGLAKDHVVTLKVFTPKGHLYRTLDIPVASGMDKRSPGARNLPGYPYPVPVQKPKTMQAKGRKYTSLDINFPVAGTTIVTSSLYGRWKVEVYLDGAAEPCGRRTFFHLRE
jgi:hypothetical protein